MTDSPGAIEGFPDRIISWVFRLFINAEANSFNRYIKSKFIAYDAAEPFDEFRDDFSMARNILGNNPNTALVFGLPARRGEEEVAAKALIIKDGSEQFRVLDFNVNALTVETNFLKEKFLVYNDAYNPFWKAYVNGKPVQLIRANVAFKGAWIPAGKNIIKYEYRSPFWNGKIYTILAVTCLLFFLGLMYGVFKEKRGFEEKAI